MSSQPTSIVNAEYFAALTRRVEGMKSCEELNAFTAELSTSLTATIDAITAQMAFLQPVLALLTAPGANPDQIVTWITDFITAFLTPYVRPYTVYAQQLVEMTAEIANLSDAIQTAAAAIPNCSVSIPLPLASE
ncbi:hypothetical protein [Lysobacter sp. GCM10012299]|uniref:hypothetical protein n=1 Tax=Lysobacter sp. GCM10012299 TaxID=3317333 RepID=UPI00360B0AD6